MLFRSVALGQIRDERALEPLILALKDEQSTIRQAASAALQRIDAEWPRSEAAQRALPELKAALKDKEYWVRQAAAEALTKIGEARTMEPDGTRFIDAATHKRQVVVEIFVAALQDADRDLRQAAAEALGRIGDRRAFDALTAALQDTDPGVKNAATQALQRLHG